MDWKKILNETDHTKLTFKEFLAQAVLVGGTLIAAFWAVAHFS